MGRGRGRTQVSPGSGGLEGLGVGWGGRRRGGPRPSAPPGPTGPTSGLAGPMDAFSTKSLALQAQKKLLGKVASRAVAVAFLDDASSEVLDELYRAAKEFTRSRKEAQKLVKNLVKVALKLAVLLRGGQLGADELALLRGFRQRARRLAMTAVSFHQVDFTFDRRVLAAGLLECRDLLHQAAGRHLTAKSHGRISHVFGHLADGDFLAALYGPAEPYRSHRRRLCEGLSRMLDEGSL
ncbi:tumor necrosis factor alpha-induced protein 8-like protein 1 isoform X1 [Equus quagga]|uniref:tumor necrosis factor alpha-induced protein 8-like protein 1 isoform X1 n=1 Tax=Equus quagga TaxID=89248 RepID=UPI001EE37F95|nr:tumor necrosis factor alpha-induced protein 8-like protein 1 isoform X1 [Equus quagga]